MSAQFSAFHWPDHVIGKRESRRIREEHNALYNSHHELLEALSVALMALLDERQTLPVDCQTARLQTEAIDKIRAAIAKAEGAK